MRDTVSHALISLAAWFDSMSATATRVAVALASEVDETPDPLDESEDFPSDDSARAPIISDESRQMLSEERTQPVKRQQTIEIPLRGSLRDRLNETAARPRGVR